MANLYDTPICFSKQNAFESGYKNSRRSSHLTELRVITHKLKASCSTRLFLSNLHM